VWGAALKAAVDTPTMAVDNSLAMRRVFVAPSGDDGICGKRASSRLDVLIREVRFQRRYTAPLILYF